MTARCLPLVLLLVAGCSKPGTPAAAPTTPVPTTPAQMTALPTVCPGPACSPSPVPASKSPSPSPKALRSEAPHQGCVNGWKEPAQGTARRQKPLDLLRGTQGFTGTFQVVDLRYFTGPDDANLAPDSKQSNPVERWYGKVIYNGDPTFRIRFIAVHRNVGEGIAAIAPYSTKNFAGHDWRGMDGEGGRSTYPGLPGKWPGMPYDYAAANELPFDVIGCLAE